MTEFEPQRDTLPQNMVWCVIRKRVHILFDFMGVRKTLCKPCLTNEEGNLLFTKVPPIVARLVCPKCLSEIERHRELFND